MASNVINVAGRRYAVGLYWQIAEQANQARKEAKAAARQEGDQADFYIIRAGSQVQYALGKEEDGHERGMISAAASVAEAFAGSWLMVFPLREGWWFVAARQDAILPDGDVLYRDEDEARIRFEEEFSKGGWDLYYAPSAWQIGEEADIEQYVAPAGHLKLKPVGGLLASIPPRQMALAAGVGVIILMLGGVGWYVWQQQLAEQEQARLEQLRRMLEANRGEEQELAIPMPWVNEPPAGRWLEACQAAIGRIFVAVPGWTPDRMGCSGTGASVSWVRDRTGTLVNFDATQISPSFAANGDRANASEPLRNLVPRGSNLPDNLNRFLIQRELWSLFQQTGHTVQITLPPPPPRPKEGDPPRPVASLKFRFDSILPPVEWARLGNIPGLVMESASYSANDAIWRYEGQVYEFDVRLNNQGQSGPGMNRR